MRLRKASTLALAIAATLAFGAVANQASANATIIVVNIDGPGEGFNDPTPKAPLGGNAGVTIGQQRLIAFQEAARIWGETLDSPVPIRIRAAFNPQFCDATSAVLGSAGAWNVWAGVPGGFGDDVAYHEALTNKIVGFDVSPIDPADPTDSADINAQFNSNLGTQPGCLGGRGWYYGLDGNEGTDTDLVAVLLHEFGHGLGFSSFVSRPGGQYIFGIPGIYDLFIRDNTANKDWLDMTNAERALSMKNGRQVAWSGVTVQGEVPTVLTAGTPLLRVNAPGSIAGIYPVGAASFGPALTAAGVTGAVVSGIDATTAPGPSINDACTALTNAADVAGKIAVVDRGGCTFNIKAQNVQAAGGIAMLVADNVADSPPAALGGVDPTITIPSVRITQADGAMLRAAVGVNATLTLDMSIYAGADGSNRALLYTPNPVIGGSSVSHWDTSATRNQLMEPSINADLTHSVKAPEDLTLAQMRDIGWFPDADVDGVQDSADQCPGTVIDVNVVIAACDSGVPSVVAPTGCSTNQGIAACAATAATHDEFTNCTAGVVNSVKNSLLTGKQKGAILKCAAGADIP